MIRMNSGIEHWLKTIGPSKPAETKEFPKGTWYIQPKLKGVCGMISPEGQVFTRRGKATPYAQENPTAHWLIGELWGEGLNQWEIAGSITSRTPIPGCKVHVFDVCILNMPTSERIDFLRKNVSDFVPTHLCHSIKELYAYHALFVTQYGEGSIMRHPDGMYIFGDCKNILKKKDIKQMNVHVIDVIEGLGKRKGILGSFICQLDDGRTFHVGGGKGLDDPTLARFYANPPKQIAILYECLKDGIPQCPQFDEVIV
jgi:hypothetical protein